MPKPTAPADPLADLRQPDATPAGVTTAQPEPEPPVCTRCGNDLAAEGAKWCTDCLELAALEDRDQLWHDGAVGITVQAWHDDETATSYLHHGANCGCRYLARLAVEAVHGQPVTDPDDPDAIPED